MSSILYCCALISVTATLCQLGSRKGSELSLELCFELGFAKPLCAGHLQWQQHPRQRSPVGSADPACGWYPSLWGARAAGNEAFGDRWSRRDGRKVEQKEEIASKSPGVMPSWSG